MVSASSAPGVPSDPLHHPPLPAEPSGPVTLEDARRIALSLPETSEKVSWGTRHWRVRGVGFAWERPLNKADRAALGDSTPAGEILAARVADLAERETLIAAEPDVFFTVPHFGDWPAILIRMDRIGHDELTEVITDAWLNRAPKRARAAFLATHPSSVS